MANRKDFLVGLSVGLDRADGRCEEGEEDFDCWAKSLRTMVRSVCPAEVLILFFLNPSPVRVSLVGALGTGSLGVFSPSSISISPTFTKVSPW